MNSKNFLSSFLFSSLLFSVFSISCDSPEAWEMSFQDSATPSMEGIIDLHHDLMFIVIFIVAAVLGVDFCMAKYSPKVDYVGLGFCFCSRPTKEENASWKETNLKESKSVVLRSKDEEYALEISLDWFVNGTSLGRFLGREVRQWLYQNSDLVDYFNENIGIGVRSFMGRTGSTWLSFELAIQFVRSYNRPLSIELNERWIELRQAKMASELSACRDKITRLKIIIANKRHKVRLWEYLQIGSEYCYGYEVNGLTKQGDSLENKKDGDVNEPLKKSRLLSHATSVPGLKIDFVIRMSSEHLALLRALLPAIFVRPQNNRDHYECTAEQMSAFIVAHSERWGWPHQKLTQEELDAVNESI